MVWGVCPQGECVTPQNPVPPQHCWHENGYDMAATTQTRRWVCCNCGLAVSMPKVKADMGVHGKCFAVPVMWEWAAPPALGCPLPQTVA
jgi:hypothetical protein